MQLAAVNREVIKKIVKEITWQSETRIIKVQLLLVLLLPSVVTVTQVFVLRLIAHSTVLHCYTNQPIDHSNSSTQYS